jgi:hypothetical protein
MKQTLFFFLLLCLGSCSKSNEPLPVPDPEPQILFSDDGWLWPGDQKEVKIRTEGTFEIMPLNDDIAKVESTGNNKFMVTGKIPGLTTVKIKDSDGQDYSFPIIVRRLEGTWQDTNLKSEIEVITDDDNLKSTIMAEVKATKDADYRAAYIFTWSTKKIRFVGTGRDHATPSFEGIYNWTQQGEGSFVLTINANNTQRTILVSTDPENMGLLFFTEDLTQNYRSRYPDKNIEKVVLSKYIGLAYFEF